MKTPKKGEKAIVHIMGPHAGEGTDTIFTRKLTDVSKCGRTFWVAKIGDYREGGIKPILAIARRKPWIYFVAPSTKGGAKDTKIATKATHYRSVFDSESSWEPLPVGMTPVTGSLAKDGTSRAFVFDKLKVDVDSA